MARFVWITGAHGFIGRHLARECASQGIHVSAIGHGGWSSVEAAEWGVSTWLGASVSRESLDRLARMAPKPDWIFHLAGGSSVSSSVNDPDEDFLRSVQSTSELLEWVRLFKAAQGVTLASSAAVYGNLHSEPIPERAARKPCSPYGYHKGLAEMLCERYAQQGEVRVSIVRMFSVYGPHLRKQLLWDLCTRLVGAPEVLTLSGDGGEVRDFLFVSDAAQILLQCAEWSPAEARGEVFNAGTGSGVAIRDVAAAVTAAWGSNIPVRFSGQSRSGDPRYLVADMTRVASRGWSPQVGWQDGVARYIEWFRTAVAPAVA